MHRLVIASVTLIGLVGIAVVAGYLVLFAGGGDRAATLAPANTVAYANVYLQPSTGQQANLSGLIGRLPGFADEAALDDKIDQVVQNLLATTGIDYRADVKPWLGDQIAIAAWPTGTDATQAATVILADVTDPDAASSSIAAITADQGLTFTTETYDGVELQVADGTAYALVDGMLVVGNGADAIHAVVDTSGGADSLATQPAFTDAMDEQPNDYLASFYVDLAGFAEASGASADLGGITTASAVLVAETDGLKLSGSAPLSADTGADASAAPAAEPGTLTGWMPERTVAEITVFGLRSALEAGLAVAGDVPEGEEVTSALDTLRALAAFALGVDLDADVLPLLDGETALAIGGIGRTACRRASSCSVPPIRTPPSASSDGSRIGSAPAAAAARPRRSTGSTSRRSRSRTPAKRRSAWSTASSSSASSTPDVAAVAESRSTGLTLDGTSAYEQAFDVAGVRAGTEVFVDVGTVGGLLSLLVELPDDARDILSGLGAFALTVPTEPNQIEFRAVLTVE